MDVWRELRGCEIRGNIEDFEAVRKKLGNEAGRGGGGGGVEDKIGEWEGANELRGISIKMKL